MHIFLLLDWLLREEEDIVPVHFLSDLEGLSSNHW